jgi:hypothetical protein
MVTHKRNNVSDVVSARDELWWRSFLIFLLIILTIKHCCYREQFDMYFKSTVINIMCSVVQLENQGASRNFIHFASAVYQDIRGIWQFVLSEIVFCNALLTDEQIGEFLSLIQHSV